MTEKENLAGKFRAMGISERVVSAFEKIRREDFVLPEYEDDAYVDAPLPIPAGQTISQPTTVVIMLDAINLKETDRVLEIGAGSGYNAALMGEICKKGRVVTIEYYEELADFARKNIQKTGLKNVKVIYGDGTKGYENDAPYDKIICTAAIPKIPDEWIEQLKENGIIIAPVGPEFGQKMTKLTKLKNRNEIKDLGNFIFVPARGEHGYDT
jgi:protein-L-isoaspartate(D-aspartate) O-methyltransferase